MHDHAANEPVQYSLEDASYHVAAPTPRATGLERVTRQRSLTASIERHGTTISPIAPHATPPASGSQAARPWLPVRRERPNDALGLLQLRLYVRPVRHHRAQRDR